jgi:hypothetical protein
LGASGGLGLGGARPLSEDGKAGGGAKSKSKRNGSPSSSDSDEGNDRNKTPIKLKSKHNGSPNATLRSLHKKINRHSPGFEDLNKVRMDLMSPKDEKRTRYIDHEMEVPPPPPHPDIPTTVTLEEFLGQENTGDTRPPNSHAKVMLDLPPPKEGGPETKETLVTESDIPTRPPKKRTVVDYLLSVVDESDVQPPSLLLTGTALNANVTIGDPQTNVERTEGGKQEFLEL